MAKTKENKSKEKTCTIGLFEVSYVVTLPDKDSDPKDGCFIPKEDSAWEDKLFKIKGVKGVGGPNITGSILIEFDGQPTQETLQECLQIVNNSIDYEE